MQSVIDYFSNIPSTHRSAILLGGLTLFFLLEGGIPRYRKPYKKGVHAFINIFFTLTTVLINFLMAGILLWASRWTAEQQFGIMNWLPKMPLWLEIVLGVLLLDLIGAYFIHWLEHKVRWMWQFHLIHHTDPNVDTTTANRHHPGESVFRFVFTTLGVVFAGTNIGIVMLYQSMSVVLSQFNHANIRVPAALENALSWVFITPSMHRVHHHYKQPYTDTNYGNIFSFWDRLFGTYAMMKAEDIVFGVDTYMEEKEHSNVGELLKIPFGKYRPPTD